MGDVIRQDRAYTIGMLHKLLQMYEQEYQDARGEMDDESMHAVMFLLLTCLGEIWGQGTGE